MWINDLNVRLRNKSHVPTAPPRPQEVEIAIGGRRPRRIVRGRGTSSVSQVQSWQREAGWKAEESAFTCCCFSHCVDGMFCGLVASSDTSTWTVIYGASSNVHVNLIDDPWDRFHTCASTGELFHVVTCYVTYYFSYLNEITVFSTSAPIRIRANFTLR